MNKQGNKTIYCPYILTDVVGVEELQDDEMLCYYDEPQLFTCKSLKDNALYLLLLDHEVDVTKTEYITIPIDKETAEYIKSDKVDTDFIISTIENSPVKYRTAVIDRKLMLFKTHCSGV